MNSSVYDAYDQMIYNLNVVAAVSSLDIPVEDITTISMHVEWTYNESEMPISGVTITHTAINNNATPSDGVMNVTYPDTSAVITNLQPLTTYRISIVVNSEISNIFGSSPARYRTADTLPLSKYT